MEYIFRVRRKVLASSLPNVKRDKMILLFDVEPDIIENRGMRLDLDIIFHRIVIFRKKSGLPSNYFIGCKEAEVKVATEDPKARVIRYTPAATLEVNYKNSETPRTRKSTVGLTLKPKVQTAGVEASLGAAEVRWEAGAESHHEATYSSAERTLTPKDFGNEIRWEIVLPRGEKVISDFLSGNVPLFVEFRPVSPPVDGIISVSTSHASFFGPDRTELSGWKRIMARYLAQEQGVKLNSVGSVSTRFFLRKAENTD